MYLHVHVHIHVLYISQWYYLFIFSIVKSESHTAPLLSRSTSQTSTTDPPSIPPSDGVVSMETEPPERKPSLPGTPGTDPKKLPPITPTSSSGIPQLSSGIDEYMYIYMCLYMCFYCTV